jgi:hypothetical protein
MRSFLVSLLTVLAAATASGQLVDADLAAAQNGGGCYPTGLHPALFDMITLVDPEWAPLVNGTVVDSDPILVHATATGMHGDTGGDFPATHVRSDVNYFLQPDPEDEHFLGTANGGNLEFEWEAGALPAWAWAGAGDRVVALGRWIFDCGHPDPRAGNCSQTVTQACAIDSDCAAPSCPTCSGAETCQNQHWGYSSELHPPYAEAVIRREGAILEGWRDRRAVPATRADVYVSADAGGAGDRCILTHQPDPNDLFDTECFPLSQPVAQVNRQDFAFDLPLPPRPRHGMLVTRRELRPAPGGVPARLRVKPLLWGPSPHLEVRVLLTGDPKHPDAPLPTGFAGSLWAGWRNDPTRLTHIRVEITGAVIRNALQRVHPISPRLCSVGHAPCETNADCAAGVCRGAGTAKAWHLQVAADGHWTELAGLESVSAGDVIPQSIRYDEYLPADGALHLEMDGVARECVTSMFGKSLNTDILELGLTNGIACLNSTEHSAGRIDVRYPGPDFGSGAGVADYESVSSGGEGGHCSATSLQQCVVDEDCPGIESCVAEGGAVALRYRIEKLPACPHRDHGAWWDRDHDEDDCEER